MRYVSCIFCVLLVLSGCATGPKTESVEQTTPEVAPENPAEPGVESTGHTPIPNPYDAQPEPDDEQVRELFDQANQAIVNRQWAKAESLLLKAIDLGPSYSGLYFNLARVYEGMDRVDDAEAQYQNAIAINANNIYAINAWARLKRERGQFVEAESLYKQALAVWPDHADSHKNLGILYDLYMGKLGQALEQYRQYQALQPEEDRLVKAWIVDLERRLPAQSEPATESEPHEQASPEVESGTEQEAGK